MIYTAFIILMAFVGVVGALVVSFRCPFVFYSTMILGTTSTASLGAFALGSLSIPILFLRGKKEARTTILEISTSFSSFLLVIFLPNHLRHEQDCMLYLPLLISTY